MRGPEVLLTSSFQRKLKEQGFPVNDIVSDLATASERKQSPIGSLRRWTGLTNEATREGIFNEDKDSTAPKINKAILNLLKPWVITKTNQGFPVITAKEIARITRLSSEKVINVLTKYPLAFSINGSDFITAIQKPEFPKERIGLNDSASYGLSPKRVARDARYLSRNPGGGPVQKAGIKNEWVDSVIRKKAWHEQEIRFNQTISRDETVDYGVMEDLEIPIQDTGKTVEEIIYAEPEGTEIMQVFKWFKEVGFGKNWVYRNNEIGFSENLVKLSRGEPVDFLIWNCIGFKWFKDAGGEMPSCNINNNLDAAITPFFKQKIQDVAKVLSTIGNPNITILVPSNEALDGRVWRYRQYREERENVIDQAVSGLTDTFKGLPLPTNASLNVTRWDDYLASRCAEERPEDYSQKGENRLKESANFRKIIKEATKSGRGYFAQNGITNIGNDVFEKRQVMYYGVYAGEGVAFEELQAKGQGITVINFEEMRVPQMAFLGALGNLAIVTPIKSEEMVGYYRWEERQIAKRK